MRITLSDSSPPLPNRRAKQFKEFGMVNEIDCRDPNTLHVAELMNWRVQKLSLHN